MDQISTKAKTIPAIFVVIFEIPAANVLALDIPSIAVVTPLIVVATIKPIAIKASFIKIMYHFIILFRQCWNKISSSIMIIKGILVSFLWVIRRKRFI